MVFGELNRLEKCFNVFHWSNFWSISLEDQVDHQKPLFSEERCIAYVKTGVCNCMEIGIGSRTTNIFLKFLLLSTLTKCIHFEKKKKNLLLKIILYCIQLCSNNILLRCNGTSHTTYLSSLTTRAHVSILKLHGRVEYLLHLVWITHQLGSWVHYPKERAPLFPNERGSC